MHSRLIQLTTERIVDSLDMMDESDIIESSFLERVGDSVSTDCDRKEDFLNMVEGLRAYIDDKDGNYIVAEYKDEVSSDDLCSVGILTHTMPEAYIIFKPGFKKLYFSRKIEVFKDLVESMALNNFMDDTWIYILKECIEDKYSWYIVDDDCTYRTLDNFLRKMILNDEECKFYLGGVLDYHF